MGFRASGFGIGLGSSEDDEAQRRVKCPKNNGKENGNYRDYRGYIGIMGYILGLYRDNGKENGSYYSI